MASTAGSFPDIKNQWARLFVESLANEGVITGFPNRTFRPDTSVTRAEFAVIIAKTFTKLKKKRDYISFIDVPTHHWAAKAIQTAYAIGFVNGFANNRFFPDNRISRLEVLMTLVKGLDIASKVKSEELATLLEVYQDTDQIPDYAKTQVAIATSAGLVASYPNTKLLKPNIPATRADVAVFVYQALLFLGKVQKIPSDYLVVAPQPQIELEHKS